MKRIKGFTLIELMVVIVILGILSAVIAPRIPQFVNKAKEGRTKGNLATLRSTLNIYYSDNDGWYPQGTVAAPVDLSVVLMGKYLKKIPEAETVKTGHAKSSQFDYATNVIGDNDAGYWGYVDDQVAENWGDAWMECSHQDLTNTQWTSY